MSKNNPQLCTAAEAKFAADSIATESIGGGVKRIYDNQEANPSPFPPAVDPANTEAKMYAIELNNGATLNAALAYSTITSPINGPRWKEMLKADAQENKPKED